ncbi:MAG: branched-chain amino acid aminotransferase [Rickettsiales bacterium]|nr:branched-chain amino acid aminotransferase [Rickettsiales bacterium]
MNTHTAVDWGKPFDERDGKIWFDGKMVEWKDAKIHVLNHGLHYASCVFEGIRIYNGKPFKLKEHNERLIKSAELLDFKIPYSVEELNQACIDAAKARNVENGYIRPAAWRGSEQMAVLADKAKTHVAIAAWGWPAYFGNEALEKGLKLTFSDWKRPSPETAPTASKAAGLYMICTLTKNKAFREGFDDALMLDYRNYVAEATGANFFMIIGDAIHTPIADCFLNGITRQTVIELARSKGIKVIERHFGVEELSKASEAFLTGTAAEITPIGSIKGKYGNFEFKVGEITKMLMKEYGEMVRG